MSHGAGPTNLYVEGRKLSSFFVPRFLVSAPGIASLVDMLHTCAWRLHFRQPLNSPSANHKF